MKCRSRNRTVELVPTLERRLAGYALTAAAAGISIAVRPADAKIVYTATNLTFVDQSFAVDVNNDGTSDFVFQFRYGTDHYLSAAGVRGNAVVSGGQQNIRGVAHAVAAALAQGAVIGSVDKFIPTPQVMGAVYYNSDGGQTAFYGNLTNKGIVYLGLRFRIRGQEHYGWARLSVSIPFGSGNLMYPAITAHLTGYAYETVADRPILAGKTTGNEDVWATSYSAPSPNTPGQMAGLGVLALGSSGLAVWRRKEWA